MAMAKNDNPLTEKVLVSRDTKQALMSIKEPGERYGDVIGRVLQDRKRHDFIAHLDTIAKEGDFVPLDSDPEYANLKKEMRRESKHRQAGTAVR
jgi:predicted CopG family antitoxin